MSGLVAGLTKLVAAGLICGGLLSLAAGAQKEILRFGCSCLLVILLMTFLKTGVLSLPNSAWYQNEARQQVEDASKETREKLLKQICSDLEHEIERQAKSRDLSCTARVVCTADGQGVVSVASVEVGYHSGPREELNKLRLWIVDQLSVAEREIVIQEVKKP